MYCSKCRRRLFYKNLDDLGWCENCGAIVQVSRCGVSCWLVAAILIIPWSLPPGM
jgi:hypothetical protein